MRIGRLDLLAYGPFRERRLALGPGLHVIVGPNEAGKSTTLRALSSLFFGYPARSEDAYLVGTADMALGALLEAGNGETLEIVRRRRGKTPLARPDGTPLDEETLTRVLGGLSRESFEGLFSLDPVRLRAHGQDLQSGEGALGEGLVEAGAGIVSLRKKLELLAVSRKELFLPTGKNPRINRILARLGEIRREIKSRTVSPQDYGREEDEIRRKASEVESLRLRVAELEREIRQVERTLRILPRRQEYDAILRSLAALGEVPSLPPEFSSLRIEAESGAASARAELERAEEALREIARERSERGEAPRDLPDPETVAALEKEFGAVAKTMADLPRKEQELRLMEEEVRGGLAELSLPGTPETLERSLPRPAVRRKLGTLLDRRAQIEGSLAEARRNREKAQAEIKRSEGDRATLKEIPETAPLESLLVRGERLMERADGRRQEGAACLLRRQILSESLRSLGAEDLTALRSLPVPEASGLQRMKESFRELFEEEEEIREGLARLEAEERERAQRISRLEAAGTVVTEADLRAVRSRRDAGWQLIRRCYLEGEGAADGALRDFFSEAGGPGAGFESLLRESDRVADRLAARSEEAVELALLRAQREESGRIRTREEARLQGLLERRRTLSGDWVALWPPGMIRTGSDGLPDRLPEAMAEWLGRREALLAEGERLGLVEASLAAEEAEESRLREDLADALSRLGAASPAGETLGALLVRGRAVVREIDEQRRRTTKVEEAHRLALVKVAESQEAVRSLEEDLASWEESYRKSGEEAGLALPAEPAEARDLLERLGRLDELSRAMAAMRERIGKMEEDIRNFEREMVPLADRFLGPEAPASLPERARALFRSLRTLREKEIAGEGLDRREKEARERQVRHAEALSARLLMLDRLRTEAGAESLEALPELERRSREKGDLLAQREEVVRLTLEAGDGLSLEALFASCGEASADDLRSRLAALQDELATVRDTRESLQEALVEKRSDLARRLESLQAADLFQEAEIERTRLLELSERYVEATVMEGVLRRAIELYRERNQGPLLGRAGRLLATLTRDRYRDLRAEWGEKGEAVLLVVREDGRSLEPSELSDGTRDALYLALRLAAVMRHNETAEPVPFVADDLLLTLDNRRALEAFRVLAEVAKTGQVLFLTHHPHMTELAREGVPPAALHVHEL